MTSSPAPTTVVLTGLVKRYGPTVAVNGLDLRATGGEILGIAGPNGAGKSTVVGILAGETSIDEGTIEIDGRPWTPERGSKVAVVHQEPQLFGNLSIAENLVAGRERFRVGRPALTTAERAMVAEFGLLDDVDRLLETLPLSFRQRVEIMRGLLQDAAVVLFDEPNSALSPDESEELFEHMHSLARAGKIVMLVSHRLNELAAHCHRVAVLRDGVVRAELSGDELTPERIAQELVAGTVRNMRERAESVAGSDRALELTRWTHRRRAFADVSMVVARGEILAVMGVEGAGGRELVRSLARLEPATGTCTCVGRVEYVTGDRVASLFTNLSIEENLALRMGRRYVGPLGWWRRDAARVAALDAQQRFGIKAADVGHLIASLSGGNQQKVAIAGALMTDPAVLVLEEPTRGVDIGAKTDIYEHLRTHAGAGNAVVLYCTEESEAFECADRVVLLHRGRIVGDTSCSDFDDVESLASQLSATTAASDRLATTEQRIA